MVERLKTRNLKRRGSLSVAVIGLGRFGSSLALELSNNGQEVLGIDADEKLVQNMANSLTQVVRADATNENALYELGINEFDSAVVAIGSDLEASILTVSLLLQMGVPEVWAKATSVAHGKILEQLGVHHVIFPEMDMGKRVAHMVSGESLDYIELAEDFVLVKTEVHDSFNGKSLSDLKLRTELGITVVATSRSGAEYTPAKPSTILNPGDLIIVAGSKRAVDDFCHLDS